MSQTGEICEIWRFPVKSMRGELLNRCSVGYKGLVGDRGWAIRDDEAGEVRGVMAQMEALLELLEGKSSRKAKADSD